MWVGIERWQNQGLNERPRVFDVSRCIHSSVQRAEPPNYDQHEHAQVFGEEAVRNMSDRANVNIMYRMECAWARYHANRAVLYE